jgi:predicted porin
VGDADTTGYYLEAKYKFTPQLYGALRWNQQFFGNIDYHGDRMPWGRDIWRIDSAVGYRFTPNTQLKLQYGLQHERWADSDFEHLFATQFTAKF